MSICTVIIGMFMNEQDKTDNQVWNDSKLISIQQIIEPIVACFTNGKRKLKELAIDALFNLGFTDEKYLDTMRKFGIYDSIISILDTPHQSLLWKSLR